MKRKAILIESYNVKDHTEIPGAQLDVQHWRTFLRSDLGGAWADSEITLLHKPYSGDVTAALKVDDDCYCFVAFSGHGCVGSVVLNDSWSDFAISSLRPTSKRGTLIVDACRGLIERDNAIRAKMARSMVLSNEFVNRSLASATLSEVALNRLQNFSNYRQSWEEEINRCSTGIVEMFACSEGESAGEDPTAGGYYTTLLLESAEQWERTRYSSGFHSTRDAHNYAVEKLPAQQRPEYKPSGLAYPFAVKR